MAIVTGTSGNNTLQTTFGPDTVRGLDGNDWILINGGTDLIDGGAGNDTMSFASVSRAVTVDLGISTSQRTGVGAVTAISIENVVGSGFADTLTGNSGNNNLFGEAGNDILFGRSGADYIVGGAGNDQYLGGLGRDTAGFQFSRVGVKVDLSKTVVQDTGEGLDRFSNIENIFGSSRDDVLVGNSATNTLNGGAGNDYLAGNARAGVTGNDTLYGGAGADTFGVRAISSNKGAFVLDFVKGTDKIDLASLNNVDFADLTIVRRDGSTFINLNDAPGTLNDSNLIILKGLFNLTANDFIL